MLLRICVSDTQLYENLFSDKYNVQIIGYQDNLLDVYRHVCCAFVFTRQRFGLVNRVKEAMTAGVAVIAFPEALRTVGLVENQLNVIYASNQQQFIQSAIRIIDGHISTFHIGIKAREFIIENEKTTPDILIEELFDRIEKQAIESNLTIND